MNGLLQHEAASQIAEPETHSWVWKCIISFNHRLRLRNFFNSLILLQNLHFSLCAVARRLIPLFVQSIILLYLAPRPKQQRRNKHNRFWSPARINFTFRGNFRDLRVDGRSRNHIRISIHMPRLMMNNWRVENWAQWERRGFNYLITLLRGESFVEPQRCKIIARWITTTKRSLI